LKQSITQQKQKNSANGFIYGMLTFRTYTVYLNVKSLFDLGIELNIYTFCGNVGECDIIKQLFILKGAG